MRNLALDRPLVAFDLETTGVDVDRDRIVQIGLVRLEPGGTSRTWNRLVNPERPIPAEATAIHGISDDDVRDQPTFAQLTAEVETWLAGADLAGFNSTRFDLPLLQAELRRAGSALAFAGARHLDAMSIFHQMERRDLTAAYRFYCGKELTGAHDALADVTATLEVLDAQLERYAELPRDLDALHRFCNPDEGRFVDRTRKFIWNDEGEAVFTFGKVAGRTLQEVAAGRETRGFLEWMLGKDFSAEVKAIVRDALVGTFPRRG
ncbi:MAG: 3'-5' exonuclease [Krumholzibacteria bacterium]|nr:3'-5' exonuclease [Candidatus Krumholzibacteria bacterium]